jgi:hypothetical protein
MPSRERLLATKISMVNSPSRVQVSKLPLIRLSNFGRRGSQVHRFAYPAPRKSWDELGWTALRPETFHGLVVAMPGG